MKLLNKTLATVALAVALVASASHAVVVGVDSSGSVYTGVGVLDTASRTWTSKTADSTFELGGQTVTLDYGGFSEGGADAPIDLFDNYKHNGGGGGVGVVLIGLDTSKTYNLVIYGAQNAIGGRGGSYDLSNPDLAPVGTNGDQTATFVEGDNYVRFDGLSPTGVDDRIRWTVNNGTEGIGILNGFEIEAVTNYSQVVNFDLGPSTVYSGPGVLTDSGTVWNDGDTTTSNLLDSHGNASDIDITVTGANGQGGIGSGNNLLFDYSYDVEDELTLTFSDLIAGERYDLALFGAQDGFGGRGSTFSIDGHGSKTTAATYVGLDADGFKEGDTHVFFWNVVADINGEIVVNIDQEVANGIGFLNGAQIGLIIPTPAALPAGLAMLGLIAMRRRR